MHDQDHIIDVEVEPRALPAQQGWQWIVNAFANLSDSEIGQLYGLLNKVKEKNAGNSQSDLDPRHHPVN